MFQLIYSLDQFYFMVSGVEGSRCLVGNFSQKIGGVYHTVCQT